MRARIPEPAKADELRAHEHDVAISEARGLVDEAPRSVARAQVADPELAVTHLEPRVHRREIDVLEAEVRVAAADHGVASVERIARRGIPLVVQQGEARTGPTLP